MHRYKNRDISNHIQATLQETEFKQKQIMSLEEGEIQEWISIDSKSVHSSKQYHLSRNPGSPRKRSKRKPSNSNPPSPDSKRAQVRTKSKKRLKQSFISKFSSFSLVLFFSLLLFLLFFLFLNISFLNWDVIEKPIDKEYQNDNIIAKMDFEQVRRLPFEYSTLGAPTCNRVLHPNDIQFTLVTQLSYDRMWMLNYHCQRWGATHPISVALYIDETMTLNQIKSEIEMNLEYCDVRYMNIQTITNTGIPKANYPINSLRNLALSGVKTTHMIYADVDFFVGPDLYRILHLASTREEFSKDAKFAAIIPALASKRACADENDCLEQNLEMLPDTPEEIFDKLKSVEVWPFDPYNRGGHGSTRLWAWCNQEDGTFLDIDCFQSNRYEPYVAARYCTDFPPFQEKFSGYGKNKMTQIMHMRHTGYKFAQLGGGFLIHYPHKDSGSRLEWDKYPAELNFSRTPQKMREAREAGKLDKIDFTSYKRGQIDELFVDFRRWLRDDVENTSRVPLCKDSFDDDAKLWVLNPKI